MSSHNCLKNNNEPINKEYKNIEILDINNLYEGIKVDMIADEFHFDRSYLYRLFKKITNMSIIDYINERKIIKSFNDVVNSDKKMLSIALSHGFNSLEYFSETFYRVTNFNPLALRYNDEIKKILPFMEEKDFLERLKYNHNIIINIKSLNKPKTKIFGVYK